MRDRVGEASSNGRGLESTSENLSLGIIGRDFPTQIQKDDVLLDLTSAFELDPFLVDVGINPVVLPRLLHPLQPKAEVDDDAGEATDHELANLPQVVEEEAEGHEVDREQGADESEFLENLLEEVEIDHAILPTTEQLLELTFTDLCHHCILLSASGYSYTATGYSVAVLIHPAGGNWHGTLSQPCLRGRITA